MPDRPSKELYRWIQDQAKSLAGGTQLPVDKIIVKQWNLSLRSVKRIMKQCQSDGLVVRIPGRGTFIPPVIEENQPIAASDTPMTNASARTLSDMIIQSIRRGELRRGDALPPVKYFCFQYRLAALSVRKTLSELEKSRYLYRMGKTYRIGPFTADTVSGAGREIILFNIRSLDFTNVFIDTPYGRAYRSLEHELSGLGYSISFDNSDNLDSLIPRWLSKDTFPCGMVFINIKEESFIEVEKKLVPFLNKVKAAGKPLPRIILDWRGPIAKVPRGYIVLHRGNIQTAAAREIGDFITRNNYRKIAIYLGTAVRKGNQPVVSFAPVQETMKIMAEVRNIDPSIDFSIGVHPAGSNDNPSLWLQRAIKKTTLENIKAIAGKYGSLSIEDGLERMFFTCSLEDFCQKSIKADLWIFLESNTAASALVWAKENRIDVPENIGIFSLESDPRYYYLGLSSCEVDWERIGYLMAHVVIGDLAVARTSRGFIRPVVRIAQRHTTLQDNPFRKKPLTF